ncbi:MAG: hypothetical protein COS82_08480 [Zetaproteobacteria bacterium CG06_land_8_20_14_3_00_59_53]|nr:MAG: hypothetical protein AUK36_07570 [Zetaproteobacteria bacterium CG2_30_59_37]PIO88816.1 MAG: hypothetical protein COX56_11190 [Zetaproteobacteria bacterium CG23_combo_of_CG06-09_8_20_14_all_59_86]PIQ64538.1 MAG: hypothetical protein COV97_08880 [Zetaproteobacteria bacterium CG11_big_fil_rev_8_21_14_0_20_59_439]PIU70047.1 MAG: hypothetical protein COS82_08480 [Zetaproteobacteria bacterium CG06_land_8_20_14_3_00_59_53]PIU98004.1 MAG: hypothetical protein COS62_00925 [Zetaproteobacteria bac
MISQLELLNRMSFVSERRRLEWYPPFWLMRVKVLRLDENWGNVRLRLPLNWVSSNAGGNMYGGYQANLADPIPALACLKRFPGYRVATSHLDVAFERVGNSDLELLFTFPWATHADIEEALARDGRANPRFDMTFVRSDGKVCTRIRNTVAIRPLGYVSAKEVMHDAY